jgi:hypothetical protein
LAAAWLADWKDRDGCEPWTLRGLADAHRVADDDEKAHAVLLAADDLADDAEDPLPPEMTAWLALDFALAGDLDEARERLDQIPPTGLPDPAALIRTLAAAVLNVRSATDKAKAFGEAKADIRAAAGACPAAEVPPGLGRVYRRVVDAITKDGGLAAKAWGWWQKVKPLVREG